VLLLLELNEKKTTVAKHKEMRDRIPYARYERRQLSGELTFIAYTRKCQWKMINKKRWIEDITKWTGPRIMDRPG